MVIFVKSTTLLEELLKIFKVEKNLIVSVGFTRMLIQPVSVRWHFWDDQEVYALISIRWC